MSEDTNKTSDGTKLLVKALEWYVVFLCGFLAASALFIFGERIQPTTTQPVVTVPVSMGRSVLNERLSVKCPSCCEWKHIMEFCHGLCDPCNDESEIER